MSKSLDSESCCSLGWWRLLRTLHPSPNFFPLCCFSSHSTECSIFYSTPWAVCWTLEILTSDLGSCGSPCPWCSTACMQVHIRENPTTHSELPRETVAAPDACATREKLSASSPVVLWERLRLCTCSVQGLLRHSIVSSFG